MTTTTIANDDGHKDENLPFQRVEFHGQTLWARGGADPTRTFVALKPICTHLGLGVQAQTQKIQCHPVMGDGYKIFLVPSWRGGDQETGCLRLDTVNFWLATISPHDTRRDPLKAALLIDYQRECAAVLYRHFFGASQAVPDEVIQRVPLLRQMQRLESKVDAVDAKVEALDGRVEALGYRMADLHETTVGTIATENREQHQATRQLVHDGHDDQRALGEQIMMDIGDIKAHGSFVSVRLAEVEQKGKRPRRFRPGQLPGLDAWLRQRQIPPPER